MKHVSNKDLEKALDEIHSFLNADGLILVEHISPVAELYAAACLEANSRLRRCNEYLRLGLMTEAVHFAEIEPNLLDRLALLDFPEQDQWNQFAAEHNFQNAQLLLEIAEALNQAYNDFQTVKPLLEKHRYLALSRAPMNQRLGIMRQLADYETAAQFWDADIETFEKARFREMQADLRTASLPELRELQLELTQTEWAASPPAKLLQQVQSQLNALAEDQLQPYFDQLSQAYEENDYESALVPAAEWRRLCSQYNYSERTPLGQQVQPILTWLDQVRERRQQIADSVAAARELELALDDWEPPPVLRPLAAALQRYPLDGTARELLRQYEQRLRDLKRREDFRQLKLIIISVVAVVAIVGGLIGLAWWNSQRNAAQRSPTHSFPVVSLPISILNPLPFNEPAWPGEEWDNVAHV